MLVLLGVLPPVCEELLCRGLILSSLRPRYGDNKAIVVSAALFALLHLDPSRFPSTFAAGLLLGLVLVKTGSIFASILFHMTWNGLLAVGLVFPLPFLETLFGGGAAVLAAAAVALAGSAWFLWRQRTPAAVELTHPETDVHSPLSTDTGRARSSIG